MLTNTERQQIVEEVNAGTYGIDEALDDIAAAQKGEEVRKALYAEALVLNREGHAGSTDMIARQQVANLQTSVNGQISTLRTEVGDDIDDLETALNSGLATQNGKIAAQNATIANVVKNYNLEYGSETLWEATGETGLLASGTTATLSKDVSNFDYVDIYSFCGNSNVLDTVPVDAKLQSSQGYALRWVNLSDPGSGSYKAYVRIIETRLHIIGTTLTIDHQVTYRNGEEVNISGAEITQSNRSTYMGELGIMKIVGRKITANTEIEDVRIGANGTEYASAGQAVRAQVNNLESAIPAIDTTLSVAGAAADAKKVGDEVTDLKGAVEYEINYAAEGCGSETKGVVNYTVNDDECYITGTPSSSLDRFHNIFNLATDKHPPFGVEYEFTLKTEGTSSGGVYLEYAVTDPNKGINNVFIGRIKNEGTFTALMPTTLTAGVVRLYLDTLNVSYDCKCKIIIKRHYPVWNSISSGLYGRKISIIGDSISSYMQSEYMVNGYTMWYPISRYNTDVLTSDQTWWKKVATALCAGIEVNASYSGSRVTDTTEAPDFYDRCNILGTPDTIFVALGTNDSDNNVPLGDYDFTTAYTDLSESTFRTAYIKGIKSLQANYPNAKIVCFALRIGHSKYASSIQAIANKLGCEYIYINDYDVCNGAHPDARGMSQIADCVISKLTVEDSIGFNRHYSATALTADNGSYLSDLNNVTKSGYYGLSSGETYLHAPESYSTVFGGVLIVYNYYNTIYISQMLIEHRTSTDVHIYVRSGKSGDSPEWSPWVKIANIDDCSAFDQRSNTGLDDFDDFTQSGYYGLISSIKYNNAPDDYTQTSGGILIVYDFYGNQRFYQQTLYEYNKPQKMWIRFRTSGGVWSDWCMHYGAKPLIDNKKIVLMGDSIMSGTIKTPSPVQTHCVARYIQDELKIQVVDASIGSIGYITHEYLTYNILEYVKAIDLTGCIYFVCCAGDNDFRYPIGNITDTNEGYDDYAAYDSGATIMGNLYKLVAYLHATYDNMTVVIVSKPNATKNLTFPKYRRETGTRVQMLNAAFKQFCDYYGCAFMDLDYAGFDGWLLQQILEPDGVHMKDIGYQKLALYMSGELSKYIGHGDYYNSNVTRIPYPNA